MQSYRFKDAGNEYVLVETPGFDDSNRPERDVFKEIAKWLELTYRKGSKLSGIIYLHRITEPRIQGSAKQNLNIFKQLCGEAFYGNVVIGTTFWASLSDTQGAFREQELRSQPGFFKEIFDRGSTMARISKHRSSNLDILQGLALKTSGPLKIHVEIVTENKAIDETPAASTVMLDLALLQKNNNDKLADIAKQNRRKIADQEKENEKILADKRAEEQKQLHKRQVEMRLIIEKKRALEHDEEARFCALREEQARLALQREQEAWSGRDSLRKCKLQPPLQRVCRKLNNE